MSETVTNAGNAKNARDAKVAKSRAVKVRRHCPQGHRQALPFVANTAAGNRPPAILASLAPSASFVFIDE